MGTYNPLQLDGIEFIEYSTPRPAELEALFRHLGFQKVAQHKRKNVTLYRQNKINFVINNEKSTFAEQFASSHGPSICAMALRTKNAQKAFEQAVKSGARPIDYKSEPESHSFPAIYGIGDSAVYFVDRYQDKNFYSQDFEFMSAEPEPKGFGMLVIDHLTNNVPRGEMQKWCDFYQNIFGFEEVRYFDIRGELTGLISKVMRSPCGHFSIPINEPRDEKSQIQEYLEEYHGSGIQHVALLTSNICSTVSRLKGERIEFLDTPDTYYEMIPERPMKVSEDIGTLKDLRILVDGDEKGYLLQIFTKNVIGPIFFEVIQRKQHDGFGNGNFQALFDSIERDQKRRGYL